MFRKVIFLGVMVLAFAACQNSNESISFDAEAKGIDDGTKVYLATLGENNNTVPLDTTEVSEGKFELALTDGSEGQKLNLIKVEGKKGNLLFIDEGKPLTATVYGDSLRASVVKGGENNGLMKEYIGLINDFQKQASNIQAEMQQAMANGDRSAMVEGRNKSKEIEKENIEKRKQLASENPNSLVSLMIMSDLLNGNKITNKEAKSFFKEIDPALKDYTLGKSFQQKIAQMNATDIGAKAPEFSGPTPDGDELALKDAMGKLTLIDFWASWCKPCRVENPNIVSIYNDYKDKGFSVIGVSLDKPNQAAKWKNAIESDELDWHHVSNLKFWRDPIAVKYGVKSIPKAFLIDEEGVIVAKDLRGNQLREKVAEILDEE
ncbi:MAG: redoxin domain-containing protein [Bacteroidota bacterium]